MEIVKAPNPVLLLKTKPVKKLDKEVLRIIGQMKETLLATREPKGVGLAAPQIGESLRIFITKPWEKSPVTVFINPQIVNMSREKTKGVPQRDNKYEGCLSIPNVWGIVRRAKKIKLRYQTLSPSPLTLSYKTRAFSGFSATIIQHEMDHLDGILFTQRVLEQKGKFYQLIKDKNGEEVFEEIEI